MAKNFLKKAIDEAYMRGLVEGWNNGYATGFQFCNDIYQSLLNDSDVVGKDVFGAKRMLKLHDAVTEAEIYYRPALWPRTHPEADVCQQKLDAKMGKIWGEKADPFSIRYPFLLEPIYEGGKKK